MSTTTVTGKPTAVFSQEQGDIMPSSLLGEVLSFLTPESLTTAEKICRSWRKCIQSTYQWERRCLQMLDIPSKTNLSKDLPEGLSYKKIIKLSSSIFGERFWQRYIGDVGLVPPIPEAISLKKCDKPDPCAPTTTIGKEYVWMYCPSHVVTTREGAVQKVPVSINNIGVLFQSLKTGHSSKYNCIWNKIVKEYGNKEIEPGWICMRKEVIGRGLSFVNQKALAKEKGVVITQLLHRIMFNFLEHTRSNLYPDRSDPCTYARTSTLIRDGQGLSCLSICGAGGPSGLSVEDCDVFVHSNIGLGVVLPGEVQAIGP